MELRNLLFGHAKKIVPFCRHCLNSSAKKSQVSQNMEQFKWENFNGCLSSAARNMRRQMEIWTKLFSQQCSLVASQRLRRAYQVMLLYRNLYGEKLFHDNLKFHLNRIKKKPLLAVLSASFFQWEKERITDKELLRYHQEMEDVHGLVAESHLGKTVIDTTSSKQTDKLEKWESVVDKEHFKVWRRYIPETQLYQYRVFGHFTDIPPRAFYNTQVDLGYWKDWDKQTMEVRIVDRDLLTNSEVVHWVYKFPYPMYPRDYVYVRRHMVDHDANVMVITARATEHPCCPLKDSIVRVATYTSQMVISPYTKFDENGFTYVMTYCDDPKTNFPTMCYNWMASTGVHEFLERVHRAALKKHEKATEIATARVDNSSTNMYGKMLHH